MKFEIEGLEELLSKLDTISNNLDKAIDKALDEAAKNVQNEMIKLCPVDTGELRSEIERSNVQGEGKNKFVFVGPSRDIAWRAKFIEFGHRVRDGGVHIGRRNRKISNNNKFNKKSKTVAAQPFIEPAHINTKQQNKEKIKEILKEALNVK